jgi:hypothetical protein
LEVIKPFDGQSHYQYGWWAHPVGLCTVFKLPNPHRSRKVSYLETLEYDWSSYNLIWKRQSQLMVKATIYMVGGLILKGCVLFLSGGILTKAGKCPILETLEYDWSSYNLIWKRQSHLMVKATINLVDGLIL